MEEADLKEVRLWAKIEFDSDVLFHLGSGGRDFGPLGLLACFGAGGGVSVP